MSAVPRYPVLRLNVAQYHAMLRAGILTADDPVELLAGWLIEKMPKNPRHRATTRLLRGAALIALGLLTLTGVVWLPDRALPPPDAPRLLAQLRGEHCDYHLTLDGCTAMDEWWFLVRDYQHYCRDQAVRCLDRHHDGDTATALAGMLPALQDIQTCDGGYSIRSRAVELIGRIGDRRHIPALAAHLASEPRQRLSAGATGCRAVLEDPGIIREAMENLRGK